MARIKNRENVARIKKLREFGSDESNKKNVALVRKLGEYDLKLRIVWLGLKN